MRKLQSLITVIGAVIAAVMFLAPSASAQVTQWTIAPTGYVTAASGQFTIADDNGNQATCGSVTFQGFTSSSPQTGNAALMGLRPMVFEQCEGGPFGSTWTVDVNSSDWQFHPTSYDAVGGTHGTGLVTGYIDGISMHLTVSTIIGTCDFDLSGSVDAAYNNPSSPGGSDGTLVVAPTGRALSIINKSGAGCSLIGSSATLQFTCTVLVGPISPVIEGTEV